MSILASLPCPKSAWLAWMGIPLELLQAIFLHPYFQINYPKSTRLYRKIVIPICVYLAFATLIRRSIYPLDQYLHFNFGFTTMPTFHFVCLCFIYGFHQGPVFKSEVALFNCQTQAKPEERNEKQESDKLNESENKPEEEHPSSPTSQPEQPQSSHHSCHRDKNPNQSILRNRKSKSKSRSVCLKGERDMKKREEASLRGEPGSLAEIIPTNSCLEKPPSIGELTRWVSALIMNPRGLICTWSPPENVVPIERNVNFNKFILNLILRTIIMHFWFQFVCGLGVEVVINSKGDINHFLFDRLSLPPWKIIKCIAPYFLTVMLGGGAYSGFALAGALFNIVEIIIISTLRKILPDGNQFKPEPVDPSNYPPLFNSPWTRESLTEFWGKGWQAVFRHHFLFCGAQPMYLIFKPYGSTISKLAAVMGAMGLSAAMHEFCLASISSIDPTFSSVRMFLSQGIGIVMEAMFKKITGRKVCGIIGWTWTFGWMIFNGTPMVDAWIKRSLGKGVLPISDWGWMNHLVPFGPLITPEVYEYLMSWIRVF